VTIQFVKMKKPTGSRKHPYFVMKAKDIDQLINEKVATHHINNAKFDNNDHSNIFNHEHGTPVQDDGAKITVTAYNGPSEVPEAHHTHGHQTAELISKITTALDPET
jgi:hypothetical protein